MFAQAANNDAPAFVPTVLNRITDSRLARLQALATPERLNLFWDRIAIDYRGFRQESERHRIADTTYIRYEHNVLRQFPVVRMDDGNYVVPSLSSYLLRFSEGIFYDFANYYRDHGKKDEVFTSPFGSVFEVYVGQQLLAHYARENVLGERKYQLPSTTSLPVR